jgi:hypothetical protein
LLGKFPICWTRSVSAWSRDIPLSWIVINRNVHWIFILSGKILWLMSWWNLWWWNIQDIIMRIICCHFDFKSNFHDFDLILTNLAMFWKKSFENLEINLNELVKNWFDFINFEMNWRIEELTKMMGLRGLEPHTRSPGICFVLLNISFFSIPVSSFSQIRLARFETIFNGERDHTILLNMLLFEYFPIQDGLMIEWKLRCFVTSLDNCFTFDNSWIVFF